MKRMRAAIVGKRRQRRIRGRKELKAQKASMFYTKYNKIERRFFQISISMRGRPLTSPSVFQKLMEHTLTSASLKVQCVPDENIYLLCRITFWTLIISLR